MISQRELGVVIGKLLDLKKVCDMNAIKQPEIVIDRDTYRDLDKAMAEKMSADFGRFTKKPETFFAFPPRLLGFEIVIKDK